MNDQFLTFLNPLSTNPTKWSNALKYFVGLALEGSIKCIRRFNAVSLCEIIQSIAFFTIGGKTAGNA